MKTCKRHQYPYNGSNCPLCDQAGRQEQRKSNMKAQRTLNARALVIGMLIGTLIAMSMCYLLS